MWGCYGEPVVILKLDDLRCILVQSEQTFPSLSTDTIQITFYQNMHVYDHFMGWLITRLTSSLILTHCFILVYPKIILT